MQQNEACVGCRLYESLRTTQYRAKLFLLKKHDKTHERFKCKNKSNMDKSY